MNTNLQFDQIRLPPECDTLRQEARAFLAEEIAKGTFDPHQPGHGDAHDRAFSKRIGAKGWIGMTWPKKYGGEKARFLQRSLGAEKNRDSHAARAAPFFADGQRQPTILQ